MPIDYNGIIFFMHKFYCLIIIQIIMMGYPISIKAQYNKIFNNNIRSLKVVADNNWTSLPIIELNNGMLTIDFDELSTEHQNLTYNITHCDANWNPTKGIFESDFVEGFADNNTIDNITPSTLTTIPYTHYQIQIPNSRCRPKLSGNYLLTIQDANNEPIAQVSFMIIEQFENTMPIKLTVKTTTDATVNQYHQQIDMDLSYGKYNVINPNYQIETVLLQNKQWHNLRKNAKPTYIMPTGLRWTHCNNFIFLAGNEYRKIEILSTKVPTLGIDKISWDGSSYNAYPFIDYPRKNYIYDKDANGSFLIRNSDNYNNDTESDYVKTHFRLNAPMITNGDIYINGDWTYDLFIPKYKLKYNNETKLYEVTIPLKLGYYNYQYIVKNNKGEFSCIPIEGSFYQTENTYQALVYYREQGGRTDKLVGYCETKFQIR